jgi:outer membrane lipoprotein-sorting protein
MWTGRFPAILVCAFLTAVTAPAQDLTLDEILKKNEDALGGAEAINKVQTLKSTARVSMMGGQMDSSIIIQTKRPNLVRTDMVIMGYNATAAFDGTVAWMINPASGSSAPQKMDEKMMSGGIQSSNIVTLIGALNGLKAAGNTVDLLGKENVGSVSAYKIRITYKNGMSAHYYLDPGTFLPIKTLTRVSTMGQDVEVEGYPSDFKKVEGVLFPHSLEQRVGGNTMGQVTYEKIEINLPMDDSVFRMPGTETPAVKK